MTDERRKILEAVVEKTMKNNKSIFDRLHEI